MKLRLVRSSPVCDGTEKLAMVRAGTEPARNERGKETRGRNNSGPGDAAKHLPATAAERYESESEHFRPYRNTALAVNAHRERAMDVCQVRHLSVPTGATRTPKSVRTAEESEMRDPWKGQGTRKPEGGYVLVRAAELLGLWAAFRAKFVQLVDLRVYLACKELVARRTGAQIGASRSRSPRYDLKELQRLVGGPGGKRLEVSIRRLERAGLMHWTDAAITFPQTLMADLDAESVSLTRLVPVPRRMLRYIAGGSTKVMTATIFGHLLRCVFYHSGLCTSEGACKASWIAQTFGVDERNVKKARARFIELGWLTPIDSPQWRQNRYGGRFLVNLAWSGKLEEQVGSSPKPELSTPQSPPRSALFTRQTPPPDRQEAPSREYKNQKPAARGPGSGVCDQEREPARRVAATLRHITCEDLADTTRLLALHVQACDVGLAEKSEAGRIAFVAMAERAKRCATKNAPGFLASLIRRRLVRFISGIDEDRARLRLRPQASRTGDREPRTKRAERQRSPESLKICLQSIRLFHIA